jgi:hypothetical protein
MKSRRWVVALFPAVSLTNGYTMPRQHNSFYYLCAQAIAAARTFAPARL